MSQSVHLSEAQFVDPRNGADKFYRTFRFGSSWVAQYGRNGSLGTFTKVVEAASPEAAAADADKKFASKIKKGYEATRSGTIDGVTVGDDLTILDRAAARLPAGEPAATVAVEVVSEVDLVADRSDDRTAIVTAALDDAAVVAVPATSRHLAPTLPVRPMLASAQPEEAVTHAMGDDNWVSQFKFDGDRVVVEVIDGAIRVLNRQGQAKVRNVGHEQLLPFTALHSGRWVFDGEIVGRTLVLFDIITASDGTLTWAHENTTFDRRYRVLVAAADGLGIPHVEDAEVDSAVVVAGVARTTDAKADMLAAAVDGKREGIILRRIDGHYASGRRSTGLVKHKLIRDADVIVSALHPVKQSAELSVYNDHGNLVVVGSASTIGKGSAAGGVDVGDVWVVTYLYVVDPDHPRLFQPRLVRHRRDKAARECLLSQFADAGTSKAV